MNSDSEHGRATSSEWEQWIADHAPGLLLYARQQARSEPDAQDLVQEAIVESCERQGGERPPRPALVYATIRRRAVDLARSCDRRTQRELAAAAEAPQCWFDDSPEDRERSQLIEEAMRKLPEIYREVLILRIWGELTFSEIADATRLPANTVASRYRYALAELRKLTSTIQHEP